VSALLVRARAAAQVLVADLENLGLDDADVHHLGRVLRLRDGESVVACDGAGRWRLSTWRAGRDLRGVLEPASDIEVDDAPVPAVTVWLSPVKGERAEWAVAKLTELGVDAIGLLTCDHGVVKADHVGAERTLARWHRVVREATCQSRRTRLPSLLGPSAVATAVGLGAVRCDLDGAGGGGVPDGVTALAVGPEGGWSATERALGGPTVSLADSVLRTETAAVVAGVTLTSRRRLLWRGACAGAQ
jgi:16S rRNA (uracil1498-N3)-methyltransferase